MGVKGWGGRVYGWYRSREGVVRVKMWGGGSLGVVEV